MPITNNGWPALARQRKRQAQHANEPCCLCGKPIPYGTAYRIPMGDRIRINPWYPTWGSPDFVDIHYPVFHGRLERMVRYGCEEEVVYPEVPA